MGPLMPLRLWWLLGLSVLKEAFEPQGNAGSFPVRHQSHLQRCTEMLSSQAHVSTQSAIGKREERLPATLALACDTVSEEKCFSALFHLQLEGPGAFDTGFQTAQARGSKLVTEDWKPVGSGRFRERSQDSAWILGTSCSGSPTGCATRYTSAAEMARERALLHSEHVQRGETSLTLKAEETR